VTIKIQTLRQCVQKQKEAFASKEPNFEIEIDSLKTRCRNIPLEWENGRRGEKLRF